MKKNYKFIKDSLSNGVLFSALFIKKNGTERKMLARTGVTKGLVKEGERKREPVKVPEHLLTVWDMQASSYKYINLNTLKQLKVNGETYIF